MTNFKIHLYTSFKDIESLWRKFESQSDHYAFQQFDWLSQWYVSIGQPTGCKLCLVVVEDSSHSPVLLLPLGIEKHFGLDCLVWLGGDVSDYHGPLLGNGFNDKIKQAEFNDLWATIQQKLPRYQAIRFEKMPDLIGEQQNPFTQLACIPNASNAHFTKLVAPLDSFLKNKRSSKSISTEKRKHRRLQEFGHVEFVVAHSPEQIQFFLDAMIRQKVRSYADMGVANLFSSQNVLNFFTAISNDCCPKGFVHLSVLLINGRVIAAHWGLVYQKRFYHLYPSYEQSELTRYAPGGLLMWHLFQWCMEHGIEFYDFTIGDEAYKDQWCDLELKLFDYYQGNSLIGAVYSVLTSTLKSAKRTIKQNPKLWQLAQQIRSRLK